MDSNVFQSQDCKKLRELQDCSSALKASVYVQNCKLEGRSVIVKDFSHSPVLLRKTLCRLFLNREINALERLRGVDGVPRLLGRYGQDGFVMELVEGEHPSKKQFKGSIVLERELRVLLKNLHKAGVTHNDVRMKNIIISNSGKMFMIDYAAAFVLGEKSDPFYYLKLPLYHFLKLIDESKIVDFTSNNHSSDRKVFRVLRKLHIVVDGWKFLLKVIRRK